MFVSFKLHLFVFYLKSIYRLSLLSPSSAQKWKTFKLNGDIESEGVPSALEGNREFIARTHDHGALIIGNMKYDEKAQH